MRRLAVATLLALAACHGQQGPGVTLDADEDARNTTGAKIDADLAAADAAARKPLPATQPPAATGQDPAKGRTAETDREGTASPDQNETDGNGEGG